MDSALVPAETALQMATLNGARAVLWDDAARAWGGANAERP